MAELVPDGFTARPVLREENDLIWTSTRSDSTEFQGIPIEDFFARFLDGFAFARGEWAAFWLCENLASWGI
jgi:hypothetical protein